MRDVRPPNRTSDRFSARRDATRRRIYQTAMQLFAERGFEPVSVGLIAATAGISVPTFYAHFPSKEHIVLQVPSAEEVSAAVARQPDDLPLAERLRRVALAWFDGFSAAERADALARWRVVATTETLRIRAAEFERATAQLVIDALPPDPTDAVVATKAVVVTAYLAAITAVLLAWADGNGEREIGEIAEAAFRALGQV